MGHAKNGILIHSLRETFRSPLSALLNCFVIGVALTLPSLLALAVLDVQSLLSGIDKDPRLTLYLSTGLSQKEQLSLLSAIREEPNVKQATLVTADEALKQLVDEDLSFAKSASLFGENPLPDTILVDVSQDGQKTLKTLADRLMELPAVEDMQTDILWLQRLNAMIALVQKALLVLAALLACGVVLVVGNTVRLMIEKRKVEIETVLLIGGTKSYVRKPFLLSGFWIGLGGGFIAIAAIESANLWLNQSIIKLAELYNSNFTLTGVSASSFLLILIISAVLGLLGAWFATNRHLRYI